MRQHPLRPCILTHDLHIPRLHLERGAAVQTRKKLVTYLYPTQDWMLLYPLPSCTQMLESWNAEDGVLQVVTGDGTNNFKTEQANDIVDAMTTQALALAKPNLCIACNAARKMAPSDYCGACNAPTQDGANVRHGFQIRHGADNHL